MRSIPCDKQALSLNFGLCRELINLLCSSRDLSSWVSHRGTLSLGVPLLSKSEFPCRNSVRKSDECQSGCRSGLIYISAGEKWGVRCFPVSTRLGPKNPSWFFVFQGWNKILKGEKP